MADDGQAGNLARKKWIFAVIIFVIAILVGIAVNYKIVTRGL